MMGCPTTSGGGVAVGLLTEALVIALRRHLEDPVLEGALSVLTPFAAFLLGEVVHASGVVAVVTAGLLLTWAAPRVIAARSRRYAYSFWDLSTFLINGGLFVFVGMQFPAAVRDLETSRGLGGALGTAVCITMVVIGTRLLWVHVVTLLIRTLDRRPIQRARRAPWRHRTVASWVGFRGAVPLAAVLAVPEAVEGAPFPDRNLLVLTTCVVILLAILVQGTTLPAMVRWARFPHDEAMDAELRLARMRAGEAGLAALPSIAARFGMDGEQLERVRLELHDHALGESVDGEGEVTGAERERRLRLGVLEVKRAAVTALRDAGDIDDIVLRQVQAAMDLEEARLLGPIARET